MTFPANVDISAAWRVAASAWRMTPETASVGVVDYNAFWAPLARRCRRLILISVIAASRRGTHFERPPRRWRLDRTSTVGRSLRSSTDRGSIQTTDDQYPAREASGWAEAVHHPLAYTRSRRLSLANVTHPLIDCFVQYPSRQLPARLSKTQDVVVVVVGQSNSGHRRFQFAFIISTSKWVRKGRTPHCWKLFVPMLLISVKCMNICKINSTRATSSSHVNLPRRFSFRYRPERHPLQWIPPPKQNRYYWTTAEKHAHVPPSQSHRVLWKSVE